MASRLARTGGPSAIALATAVLTPSCGPTGTCYGGDALVVPVDEACPNNMQAEAAFNADGIGSHMYVDAPPSIGFNGAVTVCWYRAMTRDPERCDRLYQCDELTEGGKEAPVGSYDTWRLCCDDVGLVYAMGLVEEVSTEGEALAAMPQECPATIVPDSGAVAQEEELEVGELLGSDFFPAEKICFYDVHYACGGEKVPGWGGLQ